ncbi:MAG: CpaE family protein [Aminipila sp.]
MEEKIVIAVIDKEEQFFYDIKTVIEQYSHIECEVRYSSILQMQEIKNIDCLIINSSILDDSKQNVSDLMEAGVKKVIYVTDSLNNPMSNSVIVSGGAIFFRYSPITSILHSIFGTFTPHVKKQVEQIQVEMQDSNGKCVALHSPCGGTGKSTVAINLAVNLAQKGLKVLVADFAQYGTIGVKLKIKNRGMGITRILSALEQLRENETDIVLEEVIKENIFEYREENLKIDVLIAANPIKMEKIQAKDVETIFNSIRKLKYDVVIADTSCELSQKNLSILQMVDKIMVISKPDVCNGWNLIQFKEIANNIGISEKCALTVNMYTKYAGFSCRELEAELQWPLISVIPEYKELQTLNNQGVTLGMKKNHPINGFINRISENIFPYLHQEEVKKFSKVRKIMGKKA